MRVQDDVLLKFLTEDKDYSHLNFRGEMRSALERFLADAPGNGIKIYSGYRTKKRQKELYEDAVKKYGSESAARRNVAPPGKSRHNHGLAADLKYANEEVKDWAHKNAHKYGLKFRMAHEPWHVELSNSGKVKLATGPVGRPRKYSDEIMRVPEGITDRQFRSKGREYEKRIYKEQLANAEHLPDGSVEEEVLKKMGLV